jgi:TRAP transporter TAXI family solute receptor
VLAAVAALLLLPVISAHAQPPAVQGRTIDVGKTGFAVRRPVFASACPDACPWGELGDFVHEAMAPLGYDVVLCRNCNRAEGPRLVAKAAKPPPLNPVEFVVGTTERFDAPVDFGVSAADFVTQAYQGKGAYAADGPMRNLRLIAHIEDPSYLLIAVKASSGITDLAQIVREKRPVKILAGGAGAEAVLAHYGLSREAVKAFGGAIGPALGQNNVKDFDVVITEQGSSANNPEASYWSAFSQRFDLTFLDPPKAVIDELVAEHGYVRVTAKWGLLRGIDRPIPTAGRTGHAVFGRADMPAADAYAIAKAIDAHREALKWYVRPYSYETRTVWKNGDVPLHPGAARYYREAGYLH